MFRKLHNNELGRVSREEFLNLDKFPVVLVLENIRSQHNIGASFRTADAFAIEKLVLCGICATPPSAEIRKAALGAEESVEWSYYNNCSDAILDLKKGGYQIISVEQTENSQQLNKFIPLQGERYAFIFGNEVKGVSQEIVDMSDSVIEIPQYGTKHSLNVSVSVGIVLWEVISGFKKISDDRL